MTTRSGTNKYSGLLYENLRNDKLDARNFFAATKPPLRWNVFGGAMGGPVIKNRTFFFSHVEFQRQRVGAVRNLTVPTTLERGGNFSQTLSAAGVAIPVLQLGLPDEFIDHGEQSALWAGIGLDAAGIESAIRARYADLLG